MAILIDSKKRVIVQGITGREGMTRTRLMKGYHTQVVAGVTPGKGGSEIEGVPVFDTVQAAADRFGGVDISVLFVPATLVRDAALEAIGAGVKLLVIVPDRVPIYDVLEIDQAAKQAGARFIGPNTLGLLAPDKGVLGMMGGSAASAREWFFPGPVGVTSRSGGITTSIAYYLAQAGIGASTVIHVGGDAIVGTPHAEVLKLFEADDQTEAVVMFGEIGTSQEETAAALIEHGEFTKPVIAYIGGKAAKSGTRFSHAGAIIEGGRGTQESKVARLREVGVHVVDSFADIPRVTAEVLKARPVRPVSKPQPPAPSSVNTADASSDLHWTTAITQIAPNEIRLRGYRIDELMGKISFSQAIYLALTGKLPTEPVGRLLDAIFVSSIDHGASPPSALAARTSASTGAPFNAAIAAGLLSINKHHGGAVEDCMRMVQTALNISRHDGITLEEAAGRLAEQYRSEKKRLPGFGHRIHTDDPRTARLLEIAQEAHTAGSAVAMIRALAGVVAQQTGRALPINVDGAMAAVLLDIGIPLELGNTFFMMARVPGLVAHVYEEATRQRPMRQIHPTDHSYDGPLPED
ncbi:MAG: citryl-CoA lyase [Anaerolineae bacterium]